MLHVTLAYSPAPRQAVEITLSLPAGATVQTALAAAQASASGPHPFLDKLNASAPDNVQLGIWGRRATPDTPLQEADRVEIWRPLQVDPKTARRQRFERQGARSAGLFAQRRPGAKPGY